MYLITLSKVEKMNCNPHCSVNHWVCALEDTNDYITCNAHYVHWTRGRPAVSEWDMSGCMHELIRAVFILHRMTPRLDGLARSGEALEKCAKPNALVFFILVWTHQSSLYRHRHHHRWAVRRLENSEIYWNKELHRQLQSETCLSCSLSLCCRFAHLWRAWFVALLCGVLDQ